MAPALLHADDPARFDLVGPKISVRVTRGTKTLPIAQVPNLLAGDKLWVKADLPPTQSNHLLLIVAFLRGTTNEPPDKWFTKIETWDKKSAEGTVITVPDGAEQALLFVAPETGGDFETLRSAVKGKPGQFIRADADLNQASFEQQRTDRYLAAMKAAPTNDAKALQEHSAKLAATLALKPNADCFKQPVDQQINCLTVSSAPLILNDGHGQTVAEALSTGPSSDFVNAASYTQAAGAGVYSAYVGAVVDLVHLVGTLRTAQYQYIPALSFPNAETLNLKLNAPPSFVNPKTVIVVGLPAVQKAAPPPLHPHTANQVACLLQPKLALLMEGAPLVYSTSFAHDLVLHLNRTGAPADLPLKPDAYEGGLVVSNDEGGRKPLTDIKPDAAAKPDAKTGASTDLTVTGTVRGAWGFDDFEGPTLTLQQVDGKNWKVVGDAKVIAGQEAHLSLQGDGIGCIEKIALTTGKDKDMDVSFKPADGDKGKNTLDLDVQTKGAQPGDYSLLVKQFGATSGDKVPLVAYSGDIHLEALKIHAGDKLAQLTGEGVANITSVQIADATFTPTAAGNSDKLLNLEAKTGVSPKDGSEATAKLKDGRTMPVKVTLAAARPALTLLSMKAKPAQGDGIPVTLGGKDEIALQGTLTFVVQTRDTFDRAEKIEVATANGATKTLLSLADSQLVLQDDHTAIANLEPLKAFGPSAFGKLQMRPVAGDGTTGEWAPLGTLVRVPQITAIQCKAAPDNDCTLNGRSLFLVQTFSADKDFTKPADVPTGFSDATFTAPAPADGTTLYLKLRDDPSSVATVILPTPMDKPAAAPAADTPQPPAPPASATPEPAIPTVPANPTAPANPTVPVTPTVPAPGGTAPAAPATPPAAAPPATPQ
ncbi:hypothetical protein [Terriglobus roseus]|nr:hypothetical protein [Terriglobus roseus]